MNFKNKAGLFYLSNEDDSTIEASIDILENEDGGESASVFVDVWQPFEDYSISDVLDGIEGLAEQFEEAYKSGEFDGYEKIKNLIEKQYETKH